jgi:hypothetical protein
MPLQRPYPELRASDADRERVVAFMREHALAGRLNDEELEERIGLAYASVTVGDLERLIADLPRGNRPAPRRPSVPPAPRPNFKPVLMVCGALFLALTIGPIVLGVFLGLLAIVFGIGFLLGPFFLVALLIALATRRRRPPPPSVGWRPQY